MGTSEEYLGKAGWKERGIEMATKLYPTTVRALLRGWRDDTTQTGWMDTGIHRSSRCSDLFPHSGGMTLLFCDACLGRYLQSHIGHREIPQHVASSSADGVSLCI